MQFHTAILNPALTRSEEIKKLTPPYTYREKHKELID